MQNASGTSKANMTEDNYVFALDIGTRSIIGVVGWQQDDMFHVADTEMREHPKRAMIDGQIEDIQQVARIAGEVKKRLEERAGFPLTRVCVAAAGRALKTCQAAFEMDVSDGGSVTQQQIYELEMGAIQKAREQLDPEQEKKLSFSCVGHSVIHYYLDDYPFTTILDHRGKVARVEIIATFLPNEVVDSLCAAMSLIGCEIEHLTLEPIAAMNAVIPTELRLLNLALVDIGAGTSDIAISDNGTVAAYTMATVAGDEITEDIIHHYLVDFQTAEEMKRLAAQGDKSITYRDILGFDYSVTLDNLLETLRPGITRLSDIICERILECNGKPPSAVFLVGGGSLVPLLCDITAEKLGVDRNKVAVGGNNFIKRVVQDDCGLTGPEYATPLGIALTAVAAGTQHGFHVCINGKRMRLFRTESVTVMDVLLLAGYQYQQIMGRNGKNISYRMNGNKMMVRGTHLQPAVIRVNRQEASISTPVFNEDSVDVTPAVNGEDAHLTIQDLGLTPCVIHITFNGTPIDAGRLVLVNGRQARQGQEIVDRDVIDTYQIDTISDVCVQTGVAPEGKQFFVSGAPRDLDYKLQDGDAILCSAVDLERLQSLNFAPSAQSQSSPEQEETSEQAALGTLEGETTPKAAQAAQPQSEALAAQPPVDKGQPLPEKDPERAEPNPAGKALAAMSAEPAQPAVPSRPAVPDGLPASNSSSVPESPVEPKKNPFESFDPNPMAAASQPAQAVSQPPARPTAPDRSTESFSSPVPASPSAVGMGNNLSRMSNSVDLMGTVRPSTPKSHAEAINETVRNLRGGGAAIPGTPANWKPATANQAFGAPAFSPTPAGKDQPTVLIEPPITAPRTIKVTLNDRSVNLEPKPGGGPYEFIDMLNLVDIDPTKPQGNIVLRLNGHNASYLEPIRHNDVIEIRWENEDD